MQIELKEVTIRELVDGYINNDEEGVVGFSGDLNIRPKYQREFVYKDKERNAVIDTVVSQLPLNIMYWALNDDGSFELLDGQQRTISICEYVAGSFAINYRYFHNLEVEEQNQILDYQLSIYLCKGTASEKLKWFRTVNIAGAKLTYQELRNAMYTGPWLTDAKRYFSKTGCPAYELGKKLLRGSPIRQDYLETAISWISDYGIEEYMAQHQYDDNALELWRHFKRVISWVEMLFPNYRKEMKGVPWGTLYNKFRGNEYDPDELEELVIQLMCDEDVTKKSGIYMYAFTGDTKYLSIRAFSPNQKRSMYETQEGICPICNEHFDLDEMEADHVTPWVEGGHTDIDNGQMLCRDCNRTKGAT